MDIDPAKQRRNLLVVSLALVVFEAGEGTASQVSFLGGGITLKEPGLIIAFAYIAMAYSLWRYWLYAIPDHEKFRDFISHKIESSAEFQKFLNPRITQFKDVSGISFTEGWQSVMNDKEKTEFKTIEVKETLNKPSKFSPTAAN